MMARIQIFLLSVLTWIIVGCANKNSISISGEILNPGNVKVVAFYEGDRKLDSVFLSDQNKFKFEREATQPRLLTIEIGKNRYPVIVSPGEELIFSSDIQNNPETYQVAGSELSTVLQRFAPVKQRKEFLEDSLQRDFVKQMAGKTEAEVESLRSEYMAQYRLRMADFTAQAIAFAKNNMDNLAGFYAMSMLDPDIAEHDLIDYADQISDRFVDNRTVNQFKEEIAKLKKLAVGQPAPEIVAYTPDNKTVRLSDFKGKYVLVDFWASWCVPCRKENPNIVRLYDSYKDKNFTVLGVSLDNNPGSWMRAIEEDRLVWTNISDLKAWSSDLILDYRIKAIPASVIVDPSGVIIGKNLRGADLENFLKKTLLSN